MYPPRRNSSCSPPSLPQALFEQALDSLANAVFITDRRGRIVWMNEAFGRLSGYAEDEIIGRTPSFLKSGKQDTAFYRDLWQTIAAGRVWRGEVAELRKDESLYTVDEVITPLRDDHGVITHYIAVHNDITHLKQQSERERYLAYHDPLTGLANRALFLDVLNQAASDAAGTQRTLALLYFDIDNFKRINDTYGHEVGDQLLLAVAERLNAAVRKTDTVARLSGDEFAILQADLADTSVAVALAQKLLHAIAQPFVLDGHRILTSVSIGIAVYPYDSDTPNDLMRRADQAMYRAKNEGRNRYQLASTTMDNT